MKHTQTKQEQAALASRMKIALALESLKYLSCEDTNKPHLESIFRKETLRI